MSDSLSGVRAKLARSLEHLMDLDTRIHKYLDEDPVDLQRQVQPDGTTSVFALVVTTRPSLDLAIRAGEVVHQLRSALDHLASQLVRSAHNQPTRQTSFPILTQQPHKPVFVHGGIDPKALSLIEGMQPYHRQPDPEVHPLAVLNQLWNKDKHRNLLLTATMLAGSRVLVGSAQGRWLIGGQFQAEPLAADGIVGVFGFEEGEPPRDAEVHASGQLFVAFADHESWNDGRPVTEILEDLHRYVSVTMLPRFERFC